MSRGPSSVVIVDDDPGMLQSISRILDLRGYLARGFESAEQFLLDGNVTEYDCLVVDVNLGGMSGIELCRQLRTAGTFIPIICITASEDPHIHSKAIEAGCMCLLRKPFTASALLDAISRA